MEEITVVEAPPLLIPAVVVRLPFPKHAQFFLQLVNREYPLGSSSEEGATALTGEHLKRIRKAAEGTGVLEVLVELVEEDVDSAGWEKEKRLRTEESNSSPLAGQDSLRDAYADIVSAAESQLGAAVASALSFHVVLVPDRPPRQNPEEWKKWNTTWPFAVPKPQPPERPTAVFIQSANRVMQSVVLALAERVVSESPHLLGIAAAVVATDGTVVVTSEGCTAMERHNPLACCAYVRQWTAPPVSAGCCSVVLEHPVMHALKKLAVLQSGEGDQRTLTEKGRHTADEEARQRDITAKKPYLANALDLFVSHEPCVMCAMSLVHSRIARVFFCFPNPVHGGLGSVYAVHTVRSLNHHYKAYHCVEAERAYKGAKLL